jgi:hypothetical protein
MGAALGPRGQDEAVGLYRVEVKEGLGGGVRILNQNSTTTSEVGRR